eukprot:COSAG05_NODE_147_length_16383_cov_266.102555_29_plen_199_part_00
MSWRSSLIAWTSKVWGRSTSKPSPPGGGSAATRPRYAPFCPPRPSLQVCVRATHSAHCARFSLHACAAQTTLRTFSQVDHKAVEVWYWDWVQRQQDEEMEQARALFAEIDVDGSGTLSKEEVGMLAKVSRHVQPSCGPHSTHAPECASDDAILVKCHAPFCAQYAWAQPHLFAHSSCGGMRNAARADLQPRSLRARLK